MKTTLFAAVFLTLPALLAPCAHAGSKIFYVGGIGSNQAQMNRWKAAAQAKLGGGYEIEAVPVSPGQAFINRVVEELKTKKDRDYIIAGHSEGASTITAITGILDRLTDAQVDKRRIRVLKLEGYAFSARTISYECWYGSGKRGMEGFNAVQMKQCGSHARRYCDTHCSTTVCLHFSVVNANAPADLGRSGGGLEAGYDNLDANVSWVAPGANNVRCQ